VSLVRGLFLPLAVLGGSAALAGAQDSAAPVSARALQACAAIEAPSERLACYDKLAGRAVAPAAAAASPPPAEAPKPSFGLYSAEHPAGPKPAQSQNAKIVGLGASVDGRTLVTLDGGQLWELDVADALLATGDSVIINRAALGSFIMTTPTGRTHRARRLH
jgi:hypothetical protein